MENDSLFAKFLEGIYLDAKENPHRFKDIKEVEEEKALMEAYAAANDDPDRKEVVEDWSVLDGLSG